MEEAIKIKLIDGTIFKNVKYKWEGANETICWIEIDQGFLGKTKVPETSVVYIYPKEI